ncbi:JAB domain-containing protein [Sphingomonas sp. CLY1604]|uniref:JAB domain-containing protein n=1 Tax=Sphingomonas sp. CLY1604 TaxID=3457786 RepID=UPI003FD8DD23
MTASPALPRITGPREAAAMFADLAHDGVERARVLYLDPEWSYLGRSDFTGSATAVAPPLRTIIGEALRLDAAALVLGHGHPSGLPEPSAADLAYTRALIRIAEAVGLTLVDHLIVAGDGFVSLRHTGWM